MDVQKYIIKIRPGIKQFIFAHADKPKDVFQELLDHKEVNHILKFNNPEA